MLPSLVEPIYYGEIGKAFSGKAIMKRPLKNREPGRPIAKMTIWARKNTCKSISRNVNFKAQCWLPKLGSRHPNTRRNAAMKKSIFKNCSDAFCANMFYIIWKGGDSIGQCKNHGKSMWVVRIAARCFRSARDIPPFCPTGTVAPQLYII